MDTKRVKTWKNFYEVIDEIREEYGVYRHELDNGQIYELPNRLLFRGQSNFNWNLLTTLERKTTASFHVLNYLYHATRCINEIESFTGFRWNLPDYPEIESQVRETQDALRVFLPGYDYLVYLRHHGFPSPLLDWTESPYIAAYFAYIDATTDDPAVYCYIESPERAKGRSGDGPMITVKGPFVTTHKRHFAQKAWYTVSTKWNHQQERHYFCQHEDVFKLNNPMQDLLFKIVLPITERKRALTHLNDYNINHFTLFQSEDSLIKALSTKEFDISALQQINPPEDSQPR